MMVSNHNRMPIQTCHTCHVCICSRFIDPEEPSAIHSKNSIQYFLNGYSLKPHSRETPPILGEFLTTMHTAYLLTLNSEDVGNALNTPIIEIVKKYQHDIEKKLQQNVRLAEHSAIIYRCCQSLSNEDKLNIVIKIIEKFEFFHVVEIINKENYPQRIVVSDHALEAIKKMIRGVDIHNQGFYCSITTFYFYFLEKLQCCIKEIGLLILGTALMHAQGSTIRSALETWEQVRPQHIERHHKLAQELVTALRKWV